MKDPRFYGKKAGDVLQMAFPEIMAGFSRLKKMGIASEIWIFGSIVRGEDTRESDIDLMLEVGRASPRVMGIAISEISGHVNFPIHILLSDGKDYIPKTILREKVRLCDWIRRNDAQIWN